MRIHILLFVIVVSFISCKIQDIKNTQVKDSALNTTDLLNTKGYEMQMKGIDFCASGYQPDWSLEIDFDQKIIFKSTLYKNIIEIPIQKIAEVGELGKIYKFIDDSLDLKIQIDLLESPFSSGKDGRVYKVQIDFKKDSDVIKYVGEGQYFGSLVLHDIWALQSINGKDIEMYQFKKRPYMEIHLDNNKIHGFLGCNTFASSIYFEQDKLIVNHLLSTKIACLNANIEADFAKILNNSSFNYKVEKGKLILWNKSDELIFKKVD